MNIKEKIIIDINNIPDDKILQQLLEILKVLKIDLPTQGNPSKTMK